MNDRGFAVTTMVYASVVLLAMVMFSVLAIVRSEYSSQREFIDEINNELTLCLERDEC